VNDVDVLVLHGSPGSGKCTLSRAVAERLRTADVANAVIDLDELSLVHPHPGRWFARDNLKAIWPNFAAIPHLKVILPTVVADEEELARSSRKPAGGFSR
jgi:ABC-type proline/glycine betaine transport system ATPase subunit